MTFMIFVSFFSFNDTATTDIYTLSLHDALPIFSVGADIAFDADPKFFACLVRFESSSVPTTLPKKTQSEPKDRKSGSAGMPRPTSYAVFCLKKKTRDTTTSVLDPILD